MVSSRISPQTVQVKVRTPGVVERADADTVVLRVLRSMRLPIALAGVSRNVFIGAAAVLLPDWALTLMGRTALERLRDRADARVLQLAAPSIRGAVAEGGLAWRACRRTGADYEGLFRWD